MTLKILNRTNIEQIRTKYNKSIQIYKIKTQKKYLIQQLKVKLQSCYSFIMQISNFILPSPVSSQSSISLSKIISQNQWYQLLNQNNSKNSELEISIFEKQLEQDKHIKQLLSYSKSKVPRNKSKKLLQNSIFKKQKNKNQSINNQQQTSEEYYNDYLKWKQNQTSNKEDKILKQKKYQFPCDKQSKQNRIDSKKLLPNYQKCYFDVLSSDYSSFSFLKNQNDKKNVENDELSRQLKKIQKQYLDKLQSITSKQRYTKLKQSISQQQDRPNNQQNKQANEQANLISENKIQSLKQQSSEKEEHLGESHRKELEEYCFENMIWNKPNFTKLTFQNKKNGNQKSNIQQQIKEQYLYNDAQKYNSSSSRSSQTHNSQKRRFLQKVKNIDEQQYIKNSEQYLRLKQSIKNKQISQSNHCFDKMPSPQKRQKIQKKATFKLNINKLLQIPYRQFIIFMDQNRRKIISMTQPQQYKQLQIYQVKCFQHVQSVERLRQKFSSHQGARLIQKLSLQQKQKLFKVLYSNQMQFE